MALKIPQTPDSIGTDQVWKICFSTWLLSCLFLKLLPLCVWPVSCFYGYGLLLTARKCVFKLNTFFPTLLHVILYPRVGKTNCFNSTSVCLFYKHFWRYSARKLPLPVDYLALAQVVNDTYTPNAHAVIAFFNTEPRQIAFSARLAPFTTKHICFALAQACARATFSPTRCYVSSHFFSSQCACGEAIHHVTMSVIFFSSLRAF